MKEQTIEPDGRGGFIAYEWGQYPSHSVLAGQTMKTYRRGYDTLLEAQEAYPNAEVLDFIREAGNSVDHLPDWEMSAREEEEYFGWHDDY